MVIRSYRHSQICVFEAPNDRKQDSCFNLMSVDNLFDFLF